MPQQKAQALTTVFSEVLANLAFMFSDEESSAPVEDEIWLETIIRYRGAAEACLTFRCPQPFSRLLAANLLGIDPEDADADARGVDAVGEFMNIVCGQLVTALHGAEEVFDLSIPETHELAEAPDLTPVQEIATSTLSVEGFPLQLVYTPGQEATLAD